MKKKILRWAIVPMVAAIGFVGLNSFTEWDESGEGNYLEVVNVCEIYSASAGGWIDSGDDCVSCDPGGFSCVSSPCILGQCSGWIR